MKSGLLFESLADDFPDDFPDDFLMISGWCFHDSRVAFESPAVDFGVIFVRLGSPRGPCLPFVFACFGSLLPSGALAGDVWDDLR